MTYDEAVSMYHQIGEPFDLVNQASERVRPETVRDWFEYETYRPAYATAWAAMMGDKSDMFEVDSPLDGLAHGAFVEGWAVALRRVGSMLGINPDVFRTAIELAGENGCELLPEMDIVRLQSVRPRGEGADEIDRYYADIEAAMLGAHALCAHTEDQTANTVASVATSGASVAT